MKINYIRLLVSCSIIAFIAVIAFFVCFAYEESGTGNEFPYLAACWLMRTIFYPAYIFSAIHHSFSNPFIFFGGGIVGVILDGLLIELIFIKYQSSKNKV